MVSAENFRERRMDDTKFDHLAKGAGKNLINYIPINASDISLPET